MSKFRNYIIIRVATYFAIIYIGLTICFILPRLTPLDPVIVVVNRLSEHGQYYDPIALEQMMTALRELYGLKGSVLDQYIAYLRRLMVGDFGPSLTLFPAPAAEIVHTALPWTLGLLLMATLISWTFGNILGAIAGYFSERKWARALSTLAVVVYPTPYVIMALILVVLLIYLFPFLPFVGGGTITVKPSFTLEFLLDYFRHAFLPAMSLVIVNYGWWFISMKSIVTHTKTEDYVEYGEAVGLSRRKLLLKYVMRNSLLPQVTGLSVALGGIFNGALITEVIFSYPGVGYVLYRSVTSGDFNVMMAVVAYSVIAVATAVLLIDILYPLIDPRIRHR